MSDILLFLQCLDLSSEELAEREVDHIDIALDEVAEHKYKEAEVVIIIV